MSNPSELEFYAIRMSNAVLRMKDAIRKSEGAAYEKRIFWAMMKDFIADGNRFVEECTGLPYMLNGSLDSLKDDVDEAFFKAVEAEEQAEEDARDTWLSEASRADSKRDMAVAEIAEAANV